jgi:hypothetical protein
VAKRPSDESREEQIASFRALRRGKRDGCGRPLLLIKKLRLQHDASLLEAERIAPSNPQRRKWVENQINAHRSCRKYALAHIRHNGDAAHVEGQGETFDFRIGR